MKLILKSSLFALFLLPGIALANVQITEIMYDVSGSDSGREWLEVTNTGAEAVDISKFKLTEGTTNHVLTNIAGGSVLAPGTSAVVADNPANFKTDWPSYNGILFDSTFSLSNTGEALAIKNASSSVQDSVSYTSALGASGDSGSLHRQGDTFVAALPNPGVYPGDLKPVPVVAKPVATKSPSSTTSKAKTTSTKTSSTAKTSSTKTAEVAAPVYAQIGDGVVGESDIPNVVWYLSLAGIVILGIAGVIYARLQSRIHVVGSETTAVNEEFEIV